MLTNAPSKGCCDPLKDAIHWGDDADHVSTVWVRYAHTLGKQQEAVGVEVFTEEPVVATLPIGRVTNNRVP